LAGLEAMIRRVERVTAASTSCARAIVMGGFSQVIGRSYPKRRRLSVLQCVSFFSFFSI
jgi:hypothetical protein